MCSASPRVGSRSLEAQQGSSFMFSTKEKAFCSRIPYLLTPAKKSCDSFKLVCSSLRTLPLNQSLWPGKGMNGLK